MVDTVSKSARSGIMARVRSQNTQPELAIRKALFASGLRYRLHRADLPGKPDLVFSKYGAVIFVHGCQWHWHGCARSRMPMSNTPYWEQKIARNQARDAINTSRLLKLGWRVLVIWECALGARSLHRVAEVARAWLTTQQLVRYGVIEVATGTGKNAPQPLLADRSKSIGD